MYRNSRLNWLSVLLLIFAFSSIYGQDSDKDKSGDKMSGFSAEFVGQVHFIQGRLGDLQKAIPGDKYSWRPAEGVRSVAQVFLHAALANYYFAKYAGYEVPSDIDLDMGPEKWDQITEDKDEITKILERSFEELLANAKKISEKDLEKNVHVFGMDMTLRNFMVSSLNHLHEHLGQAIAYARSNGVTPPWSIKDKAESN
jgi:uncharacterized damage-inducible protein DinB